LPRPGWETMRGMDILELAEKSRDSATVKRVFGEPVQQGDVLVIPVARVAYGGGGGSGQGESEKGGYPDASTERLVRVYRELRGRLT
jgi:uncharacterized spore protein YtfJ